MYFIIPVILYLVIKNAMENASKTGEFTLPFVQKVTDAINEALGISENEFQKKALIKTRSEKYHYDHKVDEVVEGNAFEAFESFDNSEILNQFDAKFESLDEYDFDLGITIDVDRNVGKKRNIRDVRAAVDKRAVRQGIIVSEILSKPKSLRK